MQTKVTLVSAYFLIAFLLQSCTMSSKRSLVNAKEDKTVIVDISVKGHSSIGRSTANNSCGKYHQNIIFRLYSDGKAICSDDDTTPGPPYDIFVVPNDQIVSFFEKIKNRQIFKGKQWYFNAGPSSKYIRIQLNYNGQSVEYNSWHELFEGNPNLVATDFGIMPLEGRDRTEVLESCSEDYKEFRNKWDFIRNSVRIIIEENETAEN